MKVKLVKKSLFIFIFLLMSYTAWAEKKEEPEQLVPPQEIFDACRDKSPNDHCMYENDNGHMVKGTCLKDTRAVLCIADPEPAKKE